MSDARYESDLAEPLCAYLTAQGYTVRSEVKDCDIAAKRGDELLIVELKKSITLTLLAQAAKRQRLTDSVYVAVPRPANRWKWNAQNRGVQHLLRRLAIGLIFVSLDPERTPVEIVFHPAPLTRRKRPRSRREVIHEITNRMGDFNRAGSTRRKLVTAYRENAIRVACCLLVHGPLSPKSLREMGTGEKTLMMLSSNVYGWFMRVEHGIYDLSDHGRKDIAEYPQLVAHYRALARRSKSGGKKKGTRSRVPSDSGSVRAVSRRSPR
jgi:hypothetical protein